MDGEIDHRIVVFSKFIEQITHGVEGFQYEGTHIGSSIFLLYFIKSKKDCTMKDVIGFLNVIPSAATRRVEKLADLELISRSSQKSDRRTVVLRLTQKGELLIQRFIQNRQLGFQQFLNMFEKSEVDVFFSVLERMVEYGPRSMTLDEKED